MKRKYGFMKDNISRNEEGLLREVIQFIALISFRISYKDSKDSMRGKLISTRLKSYCISIQVHEELEDGKKPTIIQKETYVEEL